MKIKNKALLNFFTLLCLITVILLGGCSSASKVNTTLKLNDDFSGVRVMDISLDKEAISKGYSGTMEDLKKIVDENIPKELSYTYDDDGFHVMLEFTSLEDYRKKVNAVTKENKEINVTLPESVWLNGIYIEENFSSSDLLAWFSKAMVDSGSVSSENEQYITSLGDTYVEYGKDKYASNANIYVNKTEPLGINSIDILLRVNSSNNFDRQVVFSLPYETISRNGSKIKKYFEEHNPEGAELKVKEVDNSTVYTISTKNINKEEALKFDRFIFGDKNVDFRADKNKDEYKSPFLIQNKLNENIDFSAYLPGSNSTVMNYYVLLAEGINAGDGDKYYNTEDTDKDESDTNYKDYTKIISQNIKGNSPTGIALEISKPYVVSYINVKSRKKLLSSGYTREVEFILEDNKISEEEVQTLITNFEDLKNKGSESKAEVKSNQETKAPESKAEKSKDSSPDFQVSKLKAKGGKTGIRIHQEGTANELAKSAHIAFGEASDFYYIKASGLLKIKKYDALVDNISFAKMFSDDKALSQDFKLNYSVGISIFSAMKYCSQDNIKKTFGKIQAVYDKPEINFRYVGKYIDVLSVLFYLFIIIFLISCIVLIFGKFFKRKITVETVADDVMEDIVGSDSATADESECIENTEVNKLALIENENGSGGFDAIEQTDKADYSASEKTLVCGKCGAHIPQDSRFCEKCGNKVV